MLLPLTNAQRVKRFGRFRFVATPKPGNPEAIRILDGWAEAHIVVVRCPQLERFGHESVRMHRQAAEPFRELWRQWEAANLLDRLKTWNGSWAPRFKRGRAGGGEAALSNHSWGNAFDVDARLYPLGKVVVADAPIRALVPIAESLGWFWGGNFRSRADGMHWEYTGAAPKTEEPKT